MGTLGLTADEWVILRLLFEGMNNKRTAEYMVINRHFMAATLYLYNKISGEKFKEAIGMLREERKQTQTKEYQ